MRGHGHGGSHYAWTLGVIASLVTAQLNGDRLRIGQEKVAFEIKETDKGV